MRFAAVIIGILSLVALGVSDAVRASRLTALQNDGSIQTKLDTIPMNFSGWTGEAIPVTEAQVKRSTAIARFQRVYTRGGNKPAQVTVLLLAGVSGELGAHDPERCFGGVGYKANGIRNRKYSIDEGVTHSLWSLRLDTETLPAGSIEVAWGWTAEGHWQASEDARFEFAGRNLLYKLYVTRRLPSSDAKTNEPDPTVEFLNDFAPLARIAIAGAK
ncbi:hypothetical protein BH11PLA2_BH11PLA2_23740 [soil metagenome]